MASEGFFYRLRNSGTRRVLIGYDLWLSLLLSWVLYGVVGKSIVNYKLNEFVSNATSFSTSLTAVIITGIAILVALTDTEYLVHLKKENVYSNLMFTFEYTTILSIFVSVYGIILQSYDFSFIEAYSFIFTFSYLILAVLRLVSVIVTFGDRKGDLALVNGLNDIAEKIKEANSRDLEGADLQDETE